MPWDKYRPPAAGSGYAWGRLRAEVIARDGGLCRLNLDGCTKIATTADHIVGRAAARRMGWSQERIDHPSNLQGACKNCNEVKRQQQAIDGRPASRRRPTENHPGLVR